MNSNINMNGSGMISGRISREMLMKKIQIADFEAIEANLYLDVYPESGEALDYYYKAIERSKRLKEEYAEKYGPITASAELGNKWNWIDSPWPWEGEY